MPVELERYVCEIAARADKECALTYISVTLHARLVRSRCRSLSLIFMTAKTLYRIEPILYETVVLSDSKQVTLFEVALKLKPTSFFVAHVKTLYLPYLGVNSSG